MFQHRAILTESHDGSDASLGVVLLDAQEERRGRNCARIESSMSVLLRCRRVVRAQGALAFVGGLRDGAGKDVEESRYKRDFGRGAADIYGGKHVENAIHDRECGL